MKRSTSLARFAAVLSLVALACVVVSVLIPRPVPIVIAMTIGQVLGTVSFALYLLAVFLHRG